MALATYDDLKASVSTWMARSDLSGNVADFIMLGEAHLNRELPAVETDATLTGVIDSRSIDITSLSLVSPIALFLVDANGDETELFPRSDGTFPYSGTPGEPRIWALDGSKIDFDCPLDAEYSFRLRYRQKFALSDSAPTNWLLTNHPDVYLAASIVWGGVFAQDSQIASIFEAVLNKGVPAVKSAIAQTKRAVLTVDPALQPRHRRGVDW